MEEVNGRIMHAVIVLMSHGVSISEIRDHLDWLENEEGEE